MEPARPDGATSDADAGAGEVSQPRAQTESVAVETAGPDAAPDPWAAILEAGATLLQGLAAARGAGGAGSAMAPFKIERDPATGQASVRVPLPDPAVLQRLAKAFEPWLHFKHADIYGDGDRHASSPAR